jgi:hypothetical protein
VNSRHFVNRPEVRPGGAENRALMFMPATHGYNSARGGTQTPGHS